MRYLNAFQILAFTILVSCTTSGLEKSPIDELFEKTPSIKMEKVEQGSTAGYDLESQNRVIKDPDAFNHFWNELHSPRNPIPPLPSIDFTNQMVLISIMGLKPSGGYVTEIKKAIFSEDNLAVQVVKTSPGKGCFVTAAITNPYYIIKITKSDLPVAFFEEEKTRDCSE